MLAELWNTSVETPVAQLTLGTFSPVHPMRGRNVLGKGKAKEEDAEVVSPTKSRMARVVERAIITVKTVCAETGRLAMGIASSATTADFSIPGRKPEVGAAVVLERSQNPPRTTRRGSLILF